MSLTIYISHGQRRYIKTPCLCSLVQKTSLSSLLTVYVFLFFIISLIYSNWASVSHFTQWTHHFIFPNPMVLFCPYILQLPGSWWLPCQNPLSSCLLWCSTFLVSSRLTACSVSTSFVRSYCSDNCLNAPRTLRPSSPLYLHSSEYLIYSHSFKFHAWANDSQVIFFGPFLSTELWSYASTFLKSSLACLKGLPW